jgi:hypothetical protein
MWCVRTTLTVDTRETVKDLDPRVFVVRRITIDQTQNDGKPPRKTVVEDLPDGSIKGLTVVVSTGSLNSLIMLRARWNFFSTSQAQ